MHIKGLIKENLFFGSSVALACFPLLSLKLAVYAIVLWVLAALFELFTFKKYKNWTSPKEYFPLFLFFIVYTILLLSKDFSSESLHSLERKGALFIIPLGFYIAQQNIQERQLKTILTVFKMASTVLGLYIVIRLMPRVVENWNFIHGDSLTYYIRTEAEKVTGIHSTYSSIYLLFSIFLFTLDLVNRFKELVLKYQILIFINIAFLLTVCFFLQARGPIVFFIVASGIVFLTINWKKGLLISGLSLIICFAAINYIPAFGSRFKEFYQSEKVEDVASEINSSSIRRTIHECSVELISEHGLGGVGYTKEYELLNQCYEAKSPTLEVIKNYNTHNQYFDIILQTGLIGFLVFLFMLFYPLRLKLMLVRKEYLFFKLFFIMCLVTENLLARQHGTVFFSFFNTLFISYLIGYQKNTQNKQIND